MAEFRLETERLVLRSWREADCEPFAALAQDPEVMRFLPPMDRTGSDALIGRMIDLQRRDGHCAWALEARSDGSLLGFCGVLVAPEPPGGIEIGWRLGRSAWGHGFATEAAQASLQWAWQNLDCSEIIAFTVPANHRSRAVMERIGMSYVVGGDFDHPRLEPGDPLRRHVLYRIGRPQ
jgi:RimJ/RimL family protein N-acetyltransferase